MRNRAAPGGAGSWEAISGEGAGDRLPIDRARHRGAVVGITEETAAVGDCEAEQPGGGIDLLVGWRDAGEFEQRPIYEGAAADEIRLARDEPRDRERCALAE